MAQSDKTGPTKAGYMKATKNRVVEEVKLPAIGVSPCVKLFMELLAAEACSSRASDVPVDFEPEGRVTPPRAWPRLPVGDLYESFKGV
jgi:hypothetical protein